MKRVFFIVLVLAVLVAGFFVLGEKSTDKPDSSIASFQECIDAGYPSIDTYPEECETPNGKHFVRNLPEDEIADVSTPITIEGKIVCLPHWDTSGPQTLECASGFQENDGTYYRVHDPDPSQPPRIASMSTNARVQISGTFIPGSDDKYQSVGTIEVTSITEWQIYTDETNGVAFEYPERLDTEYATAQDWPPQVQIINEPFTCAEGGDNEADRAGRTEERTVGENTYCVTTVAEGAAGSVYRQYAYAFPYNEQTMILTFSVRYPQCGNYPEAQRSECESMQASLDIDTLVDSIAQSIEEAAQ